MKALSLRQPWASLLIHGFKTWETRSWRPTPAKLVLLQEEGLLIHASKNTSDAYRMGTEPFASFLEQLGKMPYGAIIGRCRLGRLIRTEVWMEEFKPLPGQESPVWYNWRFGNYSRGRWAWEILDVERFNEPVAFSGSYSLFDIDRQALPIAI